MDFTSTTEYFNFTSTTENYVDPRELYETRIENLGVISFYIIITQCVVGLIGNSASLVVWVAGTKSSTLACSTYFKFLSASDVFALVYRLMDALGRPPVEASFMYSDAMCPIDAFLFYFAPQLSTWIVVCLSVERMLSLCFPLKFHTKGSGKRANIAFLAIVIVLSAVNIIRPLRCVTDSEVIKALYPHVMSVSGIYFLCVIPFVIITACNIIAVVRLCLQRKIGASDNRRQRIVTKLTKLSIGAGVLQCISIFPAMIYNIAVYHGIPFIRLDYEWLLTFQYICDMILYLNNTFDFLLYSFSSRDFRSDFKELFCCRR